MMRFEEFCRRMPHAGRLFPGKNGPGRRGRGKTRGPRRRCDAYFTLEAAFIIPAAFALVISLIFLAVFMYDRCLLDQDLYLACFRLSAIKEGSGISPPDPPIPEDAAYFMVEGGTPQAVLGTEGKWVTGSGKAVIRAVPVPNAVLTAWSGGGAGSGQRAYRLDPAFSIRRFRRLRYIAGRLVDYFSKEEE